MKLPTHPATATLETSNGNRHRLEVKHSLPPVPPSGPDDRVDPKAASAYHMLYPVFCLPLALRHEFRHDGESVNLDPDKTCNCDKVSHLLVSSTIPW